MRVFREFGVIGVVAVVLLAGCHSSRQGAATTATHSQATDSAAVAAWEIRRLDRTEADALHIDWAAAEFEADSIRIRRPDGTEATVYGPQSRQAAAGIGRQSEATESAQDSMAVGAVAVHAERADSTASEEHTSEVTAVARPPDLRIVFLIMIVVFFIVTRYKLKR